MAGSHAWASHTSERLHEQDDVYWINRIRREDPDLMWKIALVQRWFREIPCEWHPPPSFGSIDQRHIELFMYARSYSNLKAVTYEPDSYSYVIHGHEVNLYVLSYEAAQACELDPYSGTALFPLRPLVGYGQWATQEPLRSLGRPGFIGKDCVGSAWCDALLPMMADPRKAEDHVHILTEPDMRFFEQDCIADQDFTERVGEPVASVITQRKQAYGDHALPTPELDDILKTRTFASRCKSARHPEGVGDFIWRRRSQGAGMVRTWCQKIATQIRHVSAQATSSLRSLPGQRGSS